MTTETPKPDPAAVLMGSVATSGTPAARDGVAAATCEHGRYVGSGCPFCAEINKSAVRNIIALKVWAVYGGGKDLALNVADAILLRFDVRMKEEG